MKLMRLSGKTRNIGTRTSLFILLNVSDFTITAMMLMSGMATEINPILAGPLWRMALIKSGVVLLVILLLRRKTVMMAALNFGMALVLTWNTSMLFVSLLYL